MIFAASGAAQNRPATVGNERSDKQSTLRSATDTTAAGRCPSGSIPAGVGCIDAKPVFIEACPTARKGLRFYTSRLNYWRGKMGAGRSPALLAQRVRRTCPRYLAKLMRSKAHAARLEYRRWRKAWEHEYAWWLWLPEKFQRVGRCETGGTSGASAAGNWRWDSGTYVSAFGIIRAAFPTWNGRNTPREQYEVAASIQRRYGWGAWGCGGA